VKWPEDRPGHFPPMTKVTKRAKTDLFNRKCSDFIAGQGT
jgi:hypothetical protein